MRLRSVGYCRELDNTQRLRPDRYWYISAFTNPTCISSLPQERIGHMYWLIRSYFLSFGQSEINITQGELYHGNNRVS